MKSVLLAFTLILPLHADQVRDFWFNGAEVTSYTLSQSHYDQTHPGHAELIYVTEGFEIDKQVKDETGKGNSAYVLKLNALTTFNTGISSYRTMTSTFRPIDLNKFPHALKSTSTIQNWEGHSFQQFNFRDHGWSVQLRSYSGNIGDKDLTLPEAYLEDELWITLRLDPKSLPTGATEIVPGATFIRFNQLPVAAVKANAKLDLTGKTGTYTISYPSLGRALSIGFDKKFPHIIRAWTEITPKGQTSAVFKERLMNVEYWNMRKPADAQKREELGLDPLAN